MQTRRHIHEKNTDFLCSGCIGAFANSVALWLLGDLGITRSLGIAISPGLTPNWLYPRIVWGGIWGLH